MLQNVRVTAFTVSELLRESQKAGGGVKLPPPPPRLGSTTSTYSCYMTETAIGFFLFVSVVVLRYAIALKTRFKAVYTEEFKCTLSKFQRDVEWKTDILFMLVQK